MIRRHIGPALASLLTLAGCAAEEDSRTAVGALSGSPDTFIGFVSDESAITGYVCDAADVAFWFQGPIVDGAFDITTTGGVLAGTVDAEGGVDGTFTVGGTPAVFSLEPSTEGTTGLWNGGATVDGNDLTAGIIVRDDGAQRGIVSSRPTGVMAEPMIMPSPMISVSGSETLVTSSIGVIAVDHIVSPRATIVSPR